MDLYRLILIQFQQLTSLTHRFHPDFSGSNMSCLDFRKIGWMENIGGLPKSVISLLT